jgi:glutamate 5-kinase
MNEDGRIDNPSILSICEQISWLIERRYQIFLVTSGAVASDFKTHRSKDLRAAVGMGRLISKYVEYCSIFGIEIAQMLLTDRDFRPDCRDSLINLFEQAFGEKVVPIVNANDVIDWRELNRLDICCDNDVLFMNLCLLLKPAMAIIALNEDGFLDENGQRVPIISEGNFDQLLNLAKSGNEYGHGDSGMRVKMKVARVLATTGIYTTLAPGNYPNFIWDAIEDLKFRFGTIFSFDQLNFDDSANLDILIQDILSNLKP